MRLRHFVALCGLCVVAQGCAPLKQVVQVMICEPAAYCLGMDECVDSVRARELADEAWGHFCGASADGQYSEDFEAGFKCGFADYIYAGGNGEPPVIPPRPYWKAAYQSPEGQGLMQDWFRGYRLGAAVAKESGYREAIIIPASAGLPRFSVPPPRPGAETVPMPNADELLPPPKGPQGPKQPNAAPRPLSPTGAAASPAPRSPEVLRPAEAPTAPLPVRPALPPDDGPAMGPRLP
jgi:hypothetical protein